MEKNKECKLAIELVRETIDKGVILPLKSFGGSMTPYIRNGEKIMVKQSNPEDIVIGDIIIYQYRDTLIAHRVIRKSERNGSITFVTKGDNSDPGPSLKGGDVIGKVVGIEKPNGTIKLDSKAGRIISYVIAVYSLVTYLIVRGNYFLFRERKIPLMRFCSRAFLLSLSFFPNLLINLLFLIQRSKSKPKPNTV